MQVVRKPQYSRIVVGLSQVPSECNPIILWGHTPTLIIPGLLAP